MGETLDDAKRTLSYPINAGIKPEWEREIREELERRDPDWVMKGIVPEVVFEDEGLKAKILEDRPWKYETAKRLTAKGYPFDFQYDYRHHFDSNKGIWQTKGLSDDSNGKELKYVTKEATSASSVVSNAYARARKKEGVGLLIIDNKDSIISDAEIIYEVSRRVESRTFIPTIIIGKSGNLAFVK